MNIDFDKIKVGDSIILIDTNKYGDYSPQTRIVTEIASDNIYYAFNDNIDTRTIYSMRREIHASEMGEDWFTINRENNPEYFL